MPDAGLRKAQLRSTLRRRRHTLGPDEQYRAAQNLADAVASLGAWSAAEHIALYLAADGEIDTTPLGKMGRALGKQLFLPVIEADNSLSFAAWHSEDALSSNRYNIPEPPTHATRRPAADLDIIFLPMVGWDLRGGRLGMGGGFYDRTLAGVTGPLLVGLAYSTQQVEHIPREGWDIPLDFVATDTALYNCQGAF